MLVDTRADLLVYGNAERAIVEIAHRLAAGTPIAEIRDLRGTAFLGARDGFAEIDSTTLDTPGPRRAEAGSVRDGRASARPRACATGEARAAPSSSSCKPRKVDRAQQVIRMPSFEQVVGGSGALRARVAHPPPRGEPGQRARARPAPRQRTTCGSTRRRFR